MNALLAHTPASTLLLAAIVIASLATLRLWPSLIERNLFRPYWLVPQRQYATLVTSDCAASASSPASTSSRPRSSGIA